MHAGLFFTCLLVSADLFKFNFFQKIISGTLSETGCQTVWIQIKTDILLFSENPEYSVMRHKCDMVASF